MKIRATHLILGVSILMAAASQGAGATQIFVDQDAPYRYINATDATNQGTPAGNWFAPGFDDSGWFGGNGVFSSGPPSGTIFDNGNQNLPFAPGATEPIPTSFTQWDTFHDPYLRTHFTLTAPTALTVWIAVDNGIGVPALGTGMYLNGVKATGAVNAEGAAFRWESVFNIPADYTFAGDNVFALQLEDHGVATGFDMLITSQLGDNPIFTTNPPPPPPTGTPEPGTIGLLGISLVVLRLLHRRRIGGVRATPG